MKHESIDVLALAALSLGACQQTSNICGTLAEEASTGVPQNSGEQLQVLSSCMERWAARLARSNDPAPYVVRAAISNCDGARLVYAQWLEKGNENPTQEANAPLIYAAISAKCSDDGQLLENERQ